MAQSAPLPRRIGKFEILDRLGQGGMGTVYRARDPGLDRLVALKTIVSAAVDSEEARERFFREARAAARLQHPNIVTVFEAGDFEGTLFIAMELLEGQDLSRVIHIPRSVTAGEAPPRGDGFRPGLLAGRKDSGLGGYGHQPLASPDYS